MSVHCRLVFAAAAVTEKAGAHCTYNTFRPRRKTKSDVCSRRSGELISSAWPIRRNRAPLRNAPAFPQEPPALPVHPQFCRVSC
jgi:hypothetical protein